MLEYQRKIGVRGASAIAQEIEVQTTFEINRKTIENWLNARGAVPNYATLKAIAHFLASKHFQAIVPHARNYLDSDARLYRIGSALFELYGANEMDAPRAAEMNALLAGWWVAPIFKQRDSLDAPLEQSYIYITPISDQSFSKIHLLVHEAGIPIGSGIIFPKAERSKGCAFSMRVWSRETRREKAMEMLISDASLEFSEAYLIQEPKHYPDSMNFEIFHRSDEGDVPESVRDMFIEWDQEAIPRDLGRRPLI